MLLFKTFSKMLIVNSISIFLSNINLSLGVLTNAVLLLAAVYSLSNKIRNKNENNSQDTEHN